MKVFSKISVLALALCLCMIPMFAGCDLFVLNTAKYLSEPVASINNTKNITKEELLNAYSSYGYSQFDNGETATREGVESTLDLLVSRSLLVDYLTDPERSGTDYVELTTKQTNDIWRSVYEYLNEQISTIEDTLRTDAGLPADDTSSEDTAEEDTTYTAYESTYRLVSVNGKYTLEKIIDDVTVENESIAPYDTTDEDLTEAQKAKDIYDNFRKYYWNYTDSKIDPIYADNKTSYSDDAMADFIDDLIRAEDGKNLDKVTENVFMREVERVYKIYYENAVLTAFQENFESRVSITADMVITKYKELFEAQKEQYDANPDAYVTAKQDTSTTVYYEMNNSGWFRVTHLLVGYTDEENETMEGYATQLSNMEITRSEYNDLVQVIKDNAKARAISVLNELTDKLDKATSLQQRFEIFRDMSYEYSTDTASLGTENDMNIPINSTDDNMVPEFASASRELRSSGVAGDITDLVETQYGYHIIMYLGEYTSFGPNLGNDALLLKLDSTLLSYLSNKTMLDKIIESITLDTYSNHEQKLIETLKSEASIVYYPDAYKDIYS